MLQQKFFRDELQILAQGLYHVKGKIYTACVHSLLINLWLGVQCGSGTWYMIGRTALSLYVFPCRLTFSACQFLTWRSLLTEPLPHMLAVHHHHHHHHHHHLFWKRPFFHAKLGLDVCPKSSLSTYPKNSPLRMQTKQPHVIPHTLFPRLPFLPWPLAPPPPTLCKQTPNHLHFLCYFDIF